MRKSLWFVVLVVLSLAPVAVAPRADAAPGGEAFVVVETFTFPKSDLQATETVMCPAGARALGGGASVDVAAPVEQYLRFFYSAPLDASGLASQTTGGDVPRGWMVSVGHLGSAPTDDSYRIFVTCSRTSDAVLVETSIPSSSEMVATATCADGSRALGGGVGKSSDTAIPSDEQGPYLRQSGPVDSSGTVAGTADGDVPVGWRSVTSSLGGYGNRFFAICSATTDAVVATASYGVAANPAVGTATATCPPGKRVVSGGDQAEGALDDYDRVGRSGPYAAGQLAAVTTGTVGRAWTASSRGGLAASRTHKVIAVCVSDTVVPPSDTSPPDTTIIKAPDKKTVRTRAKFTFSAEPGATFTCRLDKQKVKACTSPFKLKNLEPGKHKVTITAKDRAGNVEIRPATYTWKVLEVRQPGCTGECRPTG